MPHRPKRKRIRWLLLKDDAFLLKCCSVLASQTHMLLMHMHLCMLPSLKLCLCMALCTESSSLIQYIRHDAYMCLGWGLWDYVFGMVLKEQIENKCVFTLLNLSLGWLVLEVVEPWNNNPLNVIICMSKGWLLSSHILNQPKATKCLLQTISQPSCPSMVKFSYYGLEVGRAPIPLCKIVLPHLPPRLVLAAELTFAILCSKPTETVPDTCVG